MEGLDKCGICWGVVSNIQIKIGSITSCESCSVKFHRIHLAKWLRKNTTCPNCREFIEILDYPRKNDISIQEIRPLLNDGSFHQNTRLLTPLEVTEIDQSDQVVIPASKSKSRKTNIRTYFVGIVLIMLVYIISEFDSRTEYSEGMGASIEGAIIGLFFLFYFIGLLFFSAFVHLTIWGNDLISSRFILIITIEIFVVSLIFYQFTYWIDFLILFSPYISVIFNLDKLDRYQKNNLLQTKKTLNRGALRYFD